MIQWKLAGYVPYRGYQISVPVRSFVVDVFSEFFSDYLPTRVFIQRTSNLDTTCISKLSRGTFFEFSKFKF